mmetsp:Transcript_24841/g.78244  ORF Transcript_24841/g.78244 Transcript_24841/m.78244 type:complete len:200 (+) Transcript_24841:1029-1628(+)
MSQREMRSLMLTTSSASRACWYGCIFVTSDMSNRNWRRAFSNSASVLPGARTLGRTINIKSSMCSSKPVNERATPSLCVETEYDRPQVCSASEGSSRTCCTIRACRAASTESCTWLVTERGKPIFMETIALGSFTGPKPSHQSSTRPRLSSCSGPSSPAPSLMRSSFRGTYCKSGGGSKPWPEASSRRWMRAASMASSL